MKAISEMTLEELQDYAVSLEEKVASTGQELELSRQENAELSGLNKTLQKRNNDLFMKVEQRGNGSEEEQQRDEQPPTPTCEDVARNLCKEIRN